MNLCAAALLLPALVCFGSADAPPLLNPGFEEVDRDGKPSRWTVLTGLDANRYGGENDNWIDFDALVPVAAWSGFGGSSRCLGFPAQGTWFCPVYRHNEEKGEDGLTGRDRGKAAAFQTVQAEAGRYVFRARLRTAEGAFWSAGFSLGVQPGAARYAQDGSTGIVWSEHSLAQKVWDTGPPERTGEWSSHESPVVELTEPGPLTVWIRFNYLNQNQMAARWQADDAELVRVVEEQSEPAPALPDTYFAHWFDWTSRVLANADFEDGPSGDTRQPFAWEAEGRVRLVEGHRGSGVELRDGAILRQVSGRAHPSGRTHWRAQFQARLSPGSSEDARVVYRLRPREGSAEAAEYAESFSAGPDWTYTPLYGIRGAVDGDYQLILEFHAPSKGTLSIDSVSVHRDGRE